MKVLSFCHSSGFSSSLLGFVIYFMTFYVHKLKTAQFKVIGPEQPVTAIVDEEIVLLCHLSPRMSAENMEVTWFRSQLSPFVHHYSNGKDQYGQQMPEYQGRTELLKDGLANGSVALRIFSIRLSDEGQYSCFVQDGIFYEEARLELKVAASGSAPHISVEGYQDGGIRLVCRSARWYPEPEVLWRDLKGQPLPSSSHTNSREASGLYETQTSIILTEHSNQNLSCLVRNTHLSQEKESTLFYISDPFFPKVNPWMVAMCVILVVLFGSFVLSHYLFKIKEKQAVELRWRRFVVPIEEANVTLDPDMAHRDLVLSKDQKSVRWGDTRPDLPNNSERFDSVLCVLGCEGFNSGRHCWEVEVGDGQYWAVGVARESVSRKGRIEHNPETGIWAVQLWGDEFRALTSPITLLPLSQVPSRIWVCLDCDQGQVTFFDAGNETLIFTFPPASVPGERIRPWVWLGWRAQLRLCP
ncbi:butyrophilin subfamily 1 member A1-like [Malaclemys terrapin pileata]|uniref:butyrophilin subfamily 1 member A1-like n=1 Tax=Malaclemys terrapin pileata TaxID=2991368 RepID=UPI0023A88EF6|nr:butyrophilin subfamily 1 member A1-like [Malaclemys terrapin pileata]